MKAIYLLIFACVLSVQAVVAQNDTLIGVLRDANEQIVKNYPVVLGKVKPRKVKTDKNGIFMITKANLNDTLYINIKSQKRDIKVPVNGMNFISITMKEGSFDVNHTMEPDIYILQNMARERNKTTATTVMNKKDISESGCMDIYCLLSRMSGVTVSGTNVRIRGISSINSGTDALVVLDGVTTQDISILNAIPIRDVNEITVLKDGSSYGALGANGVIVIKTGNK